MILYILLISSSFLLQDDLFFTLENVLSNWIIEGNDECLDNLNSTYTELVNVNWEDGLHNYNEVTILEDTPLENTILEDTLTEYNIEDTILEDNIIEDITEDTIIEDTIIEDTITKDTITKDTITKDTIVEDNISKDTILEDNTKINHKSRPRAQSNTTLTRYKLVKKCDNLSKLPVYWETLKKIKLLIPNEDEDEERIEKFIGKQFLVFSSHRRKIKNWRLKIEEMQRKYCLQISKWMKSRPLIKERSNIIDGMNLISECLLLIANGLKFTRLYFVAPDAFIDHYKLSSRRLLLIFKEIPISKIFDEIEFVIYRDFVADLADSKDLNWLFQYGRKRLRNMNKIHKSKNEYIEKMICMIEKAKE